MGVLSWALTPDPLLNYGFLAKIYAALAAIAVLLFVAQYGFEADSVTGFWLVPAPTLPALLYVLFLSAAQKRAAAAQKRD